MQSEKLVSIITPCYNGESYIERFVNSILCQTYSNIELIFINDGSTDLTEQIIKSKQKAIEDNGIKFIYIYQENAGQAAAINKGLAIFTGEYLVWTDADDIIDEFNIAKKVDFLENHTEYGFVMCKGKVVYENSINEKIDDLKRIPPKSEDNMFMDLLTEENIVLTPGVYMVRRQVFLEVLPSKKIYETRIGQNWQMLLPISYKYKCGYIDEELFTYVIRSDSHSRREKTLEENIDKFKKHEEALNYILKDMQIDNLDYYLNLVRIKYIKKLFYQGVKYNSNDLIEEMYEKLKRENRVSKHVFMTYKARKNQFMKLLFLVLKRFHIVN